MANSKKSITLLVLVAVFAVGAGIWLQGSNKGKSPEFGKLILLPQSKPLVPITLTKHTGDSFPSSAFTGKWSILFFGFTHCPDICPTTLHTLAQVKNSLASEGLWNNFQVAMISVDPGRDTPERLAQYVPFFDEEFIGLTAPVEPLTEFAKKLGILFVARDPDERGNYDVDHSAALILLNPQGQMAGVISAPHQVDVIARDLKQLAQYANQENAVKQSGERLPGIEISNAWIRPAPPGTDSLAAYMTLKNNSAQQRVLIAAQSPIVDEIMVHGTSVKEGMASMSHLDEVIVEAKSEVIFAPMSMHLMLMEPERDLALGDQVPIRLQFKDGSSTDAVFTVQQPTENSL